VQCVGNKLIYISSECKVQ